MMENIYPIHYNKLAVKNCRYVRLSVVNKDQGFKAEIKNKRQKVLGITEQGQGQEFGFVSLSARLWLGLTTLPTLKSW
jgi:hypothetical protein